MGITIKKEPFLKSEKAYRITTAVTFYEALAFIISAAVTVPLFASETSYWLMILYPATFFLFCLNLAACGVLAFVASAKTKDEIFIVQGIMHIISCVLSLLNRKIFAAIFLYGIKKDSLAEKLTGTDTDAFVEAALANWGYLLIALVLSGVLCILSTVKLAKK